MKLQRVSYGALFAAFFLFAAQILREISVFSAWPFFCNTAGAWSLPLPLPFLISGGAVFLFLSGYLASSGRSREESLGWLLILSGGLSNLFERAVYGCVGDYAVIGTFPAFNLADTSLTCGILLVVGALFLRKRAPYPPAKHS